MSALKYKIQEKMLEQNISAHALEKSAGLKPSAIQNIIYGRSKNPSVALIKAIADALKCNVDYFIETPLSQQSDEKSVAGRQYTDWNKDLYLACFKTVDDVLNNAQKNLDKKTILRIVDEVYSYSTENKLINPDTNFIRWIVKKT